MASQPGSNVSESPADEGAVEVDDREVAENPAAESATEVEASETPAPEPDTPPADDAAEVPEPGDEAAKPTPEKRKPSPVDEAIAKLTGEPVEPATEGEPGARKATDTPAAKPKDKPATDAAPAPKPGQPNDESESEPQPVDAWTPEERKHTKGRVKERYTKLYESHQRQRPFADIGEGWAGFVSRQKLDGDLNAIGDNEQALSVAIRTQAAALRVARAAHEGAAVPDADVAWLRKNHELIGHVLAKAGAAPEPPAEDTSKVELTQEVRDLAELGVLKNEDELRAVQATLNRVRGTKPAAKEPAKAEAPRATSAPAKPSAPAAPSVPWTVEDERVAKLAMRDDFTASGVKPEQVDGHYATNIAPLLAAKVQSLFPGKNPDAMWSRLSPSNRRELVKQAQSAWQAKQPAPQKPARPRAPTPAPVQGTGGTRAPLIRRAGSSGRGIVDATIDSLAGGSESD